MLDATVRADDDAIITIAIGSGGPEVAWVTLEIEESEQHMRAECERSMFAALSADHAEEIAKLLIDAADEVRRRK